MIRNLRPGEKIPEGTPRRYKNSGGYIRLRWRIGPNEQVECYEHRVQDGHVTLAAEVHHKNRIRDDNRPENLEFLTVEEHDKRHESKWADEAVRRYADGESTPIIAAALGTDSSVIYRILTRRGVQMRSVHGWRDAVTFLDLHFPKRGQCLLCGVPGNDQRHRVVDAIRERLCAGDDEEMVARDYDLSIEAVLIAGTAVDAS